MSQLSPASHRPTETDPDIFQAVMFQEMLARAIRAALQIGLPQAVTREARSTEALAQAVSVQPAPLGRVLRALADNGIFQQTSPGHFAHNALSERLRADHPQSVAAMLDLGGLQSFDGAWEALPAAMRANKSPFEQAFGQPLYPYLASHDKENSVFNRAMMAHTATAIEAVVRAYPALKKHRRVLDVGGGLGQALAAMVKHHGHLQGSVFDQPHLEAPAHAYLSGQQLSDKCTFAAGNFLTALPDGYDLYFVKSVLWNWNDDDVHTILTNIARAMRRDAQARLMVVETLLGEGRAGWASLMDVQMLVMPNGRSRSRQQYDVLAHNAGLKPEGAVMANPLTAVLTYACRDD